MKNNLKKYIKRTAFVVVYLSALVWAGVYLAKGLSMPIEDSLLSRNSSGVSIQPGDIDKLNDSIFPTSPVIPWESKDARPLFHLFVASSTSSSDYSKIISLDYERSSDNCPAGYLQVSSGFKLVKNDIYARFCVEAPPYSVPSLIGSSEWDISPDISSFAEYSGDSTVFKLGDLFIKLGAVAYCTASEFDEVSFCSGMSVLQVNSAPTTSLPLTIEDSTYTASFEI